MRVILLSLSLLIAVSAYSQRYTRNSISVIHTAYGDKYDDMVDAWFNTYHPGERYDNNTINTQRIWMNEARDFYKETDGKRVYLIPNREEELSSHISKVGKEILSFLFNYGKKDYMDLRLLDERGLYDATDGDVMLAQVANIGKALLEGGKLLDNSYFIIYDMANIKYEQITDKGGSKGEYYWSCTPVAYLYRLKWDENMKGTFYDTYWIDEDDSSTEKKRKAALYDALDVPVEMVMKVTKNYIVQSTGVEKNKREGGKKDEGTLIADAFQSMMQDATKYLEEELEKGNVDFQLSNSVCKIRPIQVKIGRKEGVKTNSRFFVYETVSKDDTGENLKEVRKGVILAGREIADNRSNASGQTSPTVFYQIAGRKIREGMTIKEKKWTGLGVEAGYRYGSSEGIYLGATMSFIGGKMTNNTVLLNGTIHKDAFNVSLGYGYGLRINNFELYPYIGAGLDTFNKNEDEDETNLSDEEKEKKSQERSAWYALGGVRMNINIYHPVQLFAGCEYDYRVWNGEKYNEFCIAKDRNIDGLNVYGGIRVCF